MWCGCIGVGFSCWCCVFKNTVTYSACQEGFRRGFVLISIDNYVKLQYHRCMDEITDRISELRGKGWSLSAIADELGVHRETAYGWVARGHDPANPKLVSMALDSLLQRKRIPKRKRYAPGSRTRSSDGDDE